MALDPIAGNGIRLGGFTLIELLVTLAVIIIVATIAVPGYQNMMATNRLNSDYNEILSGLYLARSEAIKNRENVTFEFDEEVSPWNYEVTTNLETLRTRSGTSSSIQVTGDMQITFNNKGRVESPECEGGCVIKVGHKALDEKKLYISSFGRIGRG